MDLDADDHHIEFSVVSCIAPRAGRGRCRHARRRRRPHPAVRGARPDRPRSQGRPDAPLQALVTNLDASDYLGRLAIGRVMQGTLRKGEQVALCQDGDGAPVKRKLSQLLGVEAVGRIEVDERAAGDLFVIAGFPEVEIGDTLADPAHPKPLPRLIVDEPVMRMTFGVNTSPLAGKEGQYLTSRHLRERLDREVLGNVSIRLGETESPDIIEVAARGELQLAVLIENMRREGYELQVSRPEVLIREIDGTKHEPLEIAVIDVPDDHVGTVTQAVAPARAGSPTSDRATPVAPSSPSRRPRVACSGSGRCCSPPPAAPPSCTSTTRAGPRGWATCRPAAVGP
jgi:GTP-binding protein